MRIAIGSDHAGFRLKERLREFLQLDLQHEVRDFGCHTEESCDYPDVSLEVARQVASGQFDRGVLVCGSGQGTCIAANKVPGIRAALCNDLYSAELTRLHNDTNIITLGERVVAEKLAELIVQKWLETEFSGEDRHQRRIDKIRQAEREACDS